MKRKILLTDQEANLRQLLLDVAEHIGARPDCTPPILRFTGGWVRDKLLGNTSEDIDVGISSMTGFKFGTLMKEYLEDPALQTKYGPHVTHKLAKIEANPEKSKHLETVTTRILGLEIDLVNLRKEEYAEDSRNPSMEFGTPEEDALRRDSTVNALFYNLNTSEVEDFTGRGIEDLKSKIIRTPLSPYQTFKDDPLRVLRCIRFASRLDFSIDPEAEKWMGEASIKEALRHKISPERVGTEVEKMLKGPRPRLALSYIDRLGLYNTILTDPARKGMQTETANWSRAYTQLAEITKPDIADSITPQEVWKVKEILLASEEDNYLAWILCAVVPWAKLDTPLSSGKRVPPSMAVLAVREGLRKNNKVLDIVKNAELHRNEILAFVNELIDRDTPIALPSKRKQGSDIRESLGMAIRRWGPHWRSSVIFSLLVEIWQTENESDRLATVERYALWLSQIQNLGLLEAYDFKPIVDGKQLMKALERKSGRWMTPALDVIMRWQLRNPQEISQEKAIEEVASYYKASGVD